MWIAVLLFIIAFILDFIGLVYKRGMLTSLIVIVIAFGCAGVGMAFIPTANPTVFSTVNIQTPSGNILIPQHNEPQNLAQPTLTFGLPLAYAILLVQFGLVVITIGYMFFENRKKERDKFS